MVVEQSPSFFQREICIWLVCGPSLSTRLDATGASRELFGWVSEREERQE